MAKQHTYVWVQRYVRRVEEYIIKVPRGVGPTELERFVEAEVCDTIDPHSEETLELDVRFDKKATPAEVRKFKKEAVVMPCD